ncbi:Predicted membrane protein [Kingella potus]|uniref:Predicted membrane protein n=2 Tax=Kingella potus TaxID=265175 RepID=A0A377QYZ2_9NEIS|nr:bestrophin family ion channel [Kingella potus]STR00212.1 Predicted membrane protein [Kingella potus]
MIIRPIHRISILYILQGSFFSRLWKPLLLLFLFSIVVSYYQSHLLKYQIPLNASVFTLLGIALAIFHGFCNTAAYDRFWEGRKQWGRLLQQSRSFARIICTLPHIPEHTRREMLQLQIAFAHLLRRRLRHEPYEADILRTVPEQWQAALLDARYPVLTTCRILGAYNARLLHDGHTDTIQWQTIEDGLQELTEVHTACERLNNTPIPFAYFVLMHRTIYGYCFMLPFGLVNTIGWVTPFMTTFVGYTFICLNEIINEISDPFGKNENDLSLTAMCRLIEDQLCDSGGFTLPPDGENPSPSKYIVQ